MIPDIKIRKKDWRVTGVLVNGIEVPGTTEVSVRYPGPRDRGSEELIEVTLALIARSCTEEQE